MDTDRQRLIALAERALAAEPDVIPDSVLYEWGDYYGDWQQPLTVHYAVTTPSGAEHRHQHFI
ncbi:MULTISPECIES: hypothetical protein [unclassified Curtobacterium]|uniref:hypothetical protein n=1 Tax=unclassified Curtobacterium TaxID=257496 RepID=UPI000DA021AD|nr:MULTISPECIES: hypothetical protein [unclassified Curtobacterium]PYY55893.1 hypothetical protein DEJ17_12495 [Curtobacterium sp. MCSS17_011]PYY64468.1 hypothetical protein DEJ30_08400 [Curtobacterium sp. MCPF17_003]PZF32086.1 hypothetical protein DEJ35_05550 [Curtobacterium sp. MCPF17_051]WIB72568.1 hypothetical protein DEI85_17125 [Curtobacterium sp. MCBD17_026]WIE79225.1 hypothetical protein DEJ19_001300 [Curtobacterium sp. MCSS17_016]